VALAASGAPTIKSARATTRFFIDLLKKKELRDDIAFEDAVKGFYYAENETVRPDRIRPSTLG
jgi:hypothetical protein